MIKNRAIDPDLPADEQIGTDFLQLVRYGLRRPDDRLILDSLKAVDQLLKTDTPKGPVWHRYSGDGYGEHDDGNAFDGTGIGRGWPLLTGERGHYALVAGDDPLPYLVTMAAMTGSAGLMPEQVWDSEPIQEHHLKPGEPSGSAMPLVWAHSEFIKLCYSKAAGFPVDRPVATWNRYQGIRPEISYEIWGPWSRPRHLKTGKRFIIALREPARVHWGCNGWDGALDNDTHDTELGVHIVDLPVTHLDIGATVNFTFYWIDRGQWEGQDFQITITEA